jgi:CheY-like chemotaxis protein
MTDLSNLLSGLSPEQRELLQLRLKKQQARTEAAPGRPRIPRRDPGRLDLPLSFSQQRLWFLDQWEPGNPAYNLFGAFRLSGPLDVAVLSGSEHACDIQRAHALGATGYYVKPISVEQLRGRFDEGRTKREARGHIEAHASADRERTA